MPATIFTFAPAADEVMQDSWGGFATADEHTKGGRALTSDYESIRLETKRRKWEKGTWGNDDAIGQVMLSFNGKVVVEDKALRNALNKRGVTALSFNVFIRSAYNAPG